MRDRSTKAQLLVEGKDDLHVIKALCGRHQVVETFSVQIPAEGGPGGIEALLESIPVRLKISSLRALGIVVDADQNLPSQPNANGFITVPGNKPKVGVWLMPNNRLPGMLENFVAHLIPDGDPLALQANTCLEKIQDQGLNRYKPVHRPKAFIHTWLAWQENPGQPMGQAITARVLNPGMPLAMTFVNWLDLLFR
jgi:hypothetical protein